MTRLTKVISGGQIGVDIAALRAAKRAGLQTGGFIPKGFITKAGTRPEYAEMYGMKETTTAFYAQRTAENVFNSDATLRIAKDFSTRGELCTIKYIRQYSKKSLDISYDDIVSGNIEIAETLMDWITSNNISVLNVADNADKSMELSVESFLGFAFGTLRPDLSK